MAKPKDSVGSAAPGRNESADSLSSYIQMKSPFLGTVEFEATVPEIPVDPTLLAYEPNMEATHYEPSALELSERLTAFHEFDRGLQDKHLDGICYAGVGIEDQRLLSRLEADFEKLKSSDVDARLAELRNEMMNSPEMQLLQPILSKACEGLPAGVQNLLFATDDSKLGPLGLGKMPVRQGGDSSPSPSSSSVPGGGTGDATRDQWSRMNLNERAEQYISYINETFVPVESLRHPTNPHAKIAKHYKVMPNVGLWKNRYIQAGIEGVASATSSNIPGNLSVGSILNVAKDGATQRIFEYYKRIADDPDKDVKNEPMTQERFSFVRMYSCQQSTKAAGNDNYFLLSLPPRLHGRVKSKLNGVNEHSPPDNAMDVDDTIEDDVADSVVHILSVKGQKLVLTRAGKAKRPDIMLNYTEDISPMGG